MLVIISSNSDEDILNQTGATVSSTNTGETNLKKLTQKIEKEEDTLQ
jgi:hypothetical protein